MVFRGLVFYPEIDTEKIEILRKKYDPSYRLIRPHVTVVFGVDSSLLSRQSFSRHVKAVLGRWNSFDVQLKGFAKSWDHWLFLTLGRGNEEVIKLHNELYGGILAPYLRTDIHYIPHVGLGEFVKEDEMSLLSRKRLRLKKPTPIDLDEVRYKNALEEAQNLNLAYSTSVEKLHMTEANDDYTVIKNIEELPLGLNT